MASQVHGNRSASGQSGRARPRHSSMTDDPLDEALDALEMMVEQYMPHHVDGF
jgi:hypothetical protein